MSSTVTNIVLIYADDLGRGMLSCYGQEWFATPNIDRLAAEGMRFTNAYGCAFSAPARASLLSGIHDCHEGRWTYTRGGVYKALSAGRMERSEIEELIHKASRVPAEDERFIAQIPRQAGCITGQIGKLEWGFATTGQEIRRHGWDRHYGYYDHQRCHGFYPPFLFEDGRCVEIAGNDRLDCGKAPFDESPENRAARHDRTGKAVYSQDLFNQQIVRFLRDHADQPFFLFHPSQLPHGPIDVPRIHPAVRQAQGLTDYEKEYASMVLRLDDTVGLILDELDALGIADKTMVIFCSDNGHEVYAREEGRTSGTRWDLDGRRFDNITSRFTSEAGGDIFNGNDGMAGNKFTSWEGGTRIPFIVRWPGQTPAGAVSDHFFANYDLMATFAELYDVPCPEYSDGVSLLRVLRGLEPDRTHEQIVYASGLGPALVTCDGWKLRRINEQDLFQLFHLPDDYREQNDLSDACPDRVGELACRLLAACDGDYVHGTPGDHLRRYPESRLEALPWVLR